jgi:SGNH hydrolase-like domain, acetyltransferase AlgX
MKTITLREVGMRLALILVSFGFGLLIAELAIRWLRPQTVWSMSPGLFYEDESGYRLEPDYRGVSTNRTEFTHQIAINSRGLRGPEVGEKTEGVCRILAIGDSFTFGVGVEDDETFPVLLAQKLTGLGVPAESLNGGIPGIGVPQEVRWLEYHGLEFEPDMVLLAVFTGNDLLDATILKRGGVELVDGQVVLDEALWRPKHWLYNHSHLYVLIKRAVPSGLQKEIRGLLGMADPGSLRRARESFEFYARRETETTVLGKRNTAIALDRLSELSREHGFGLAALVIPDLPQVDPELWAAAVRQMDADASDYDPQKPTRIVLDLLAERGIPTLDLTRPFTEALARGERLYYPEDRHWTAAGHERASSLLAELMQARQIGCPARGEDGS